MPDITDTELDQWQALCDAAMPGPWWSDDPSWIEVNDISVYRGDKDDPYCICNMGDTICVVHCDDEDDQAQMIKEATQDYANSLLVAAARTALPRAIAEIRRLRGANDSLRSIIKSLNGGKEMEFRHGIPVISPEMAEKMSPEWLAGSERDRYL